MDKFLAAGASKKAAA